jgi:hypothetical protein
VPGDPTHYILPPTGDTLAGFPGTFRAKPKTRFPGGKRRRWKDAAGNIYEWDYLHGRVEKWNRRGDRHLGDFDHQTGRRIGAPDPARRPVDP